EPRQIGPGLLAIGNVALEDAAVIADEDGGVAHDRRHVMMRAPVQEREIDLVLDRRIPVPQSPLVRPAPAGREPMMHIGTSDLRDLAASVDEAAAEIRLLEIILVLLVEPAEL